MKEKESIRSWTVQENQNETRKEVIYKVRKRKTIGSWIGMVMVTVVSLVMVMFLTQVQALVSCPGSTADYDSDGFTDAQECAGLTLADSSPFPGLSSQAPRAERLDPNTNDLFLILVSASPSNLPANPLLYITNPLADGGLALTTHVITLNQAGSDRSITPTQKAMRITESLDTSSPDVLGVANYGTPNMLDLATVYTERIKNHVNSVYASAGAQVPAGLIDTYIKHTIAHEAGHTMALTTTYNDRFGGYHYKTGTNVLLDQSVYYTSKGGVVNFYIGTKYTSADQSGFKLK